jgi:hypothetical protein
MWYNWLIIFDFQTLYLEDIMNISDRLHKLRISYTMSLNYIQFLKLIATEHKEQRPKMTRFKCDFLFLLLIRRCGVCTTSTYNAG